MASRKLRSAPPEAGGGKKLKNQLGIVKRMLKEVACYEREVVANEARVQKMRDDGKDPYDIRKQEEVLQESYMMIPDSKTRLEATLVELNGCVEECKDDAEVDAALLEEARTILASGAV